MGLILAFPELTIATATFVFIYTDNVIAHIVDNYPKKKKDTQND